MIHTSKEIISDLILMSTSHINYAKQLLEFSDHNLQYKSSEKSWSALECLEHLNRYAVFYNKEIGKKMKLSSLPFSKTFKSSFLGNKFSMDMLPKKGIEPITLFRVVAGINVPLKLTNLSDST